MYLVRWNIVLVVWVKWGGVNYGKYVIVFDIDNNGWCWVRLIVNYGFFNFFVS